MTDNFGVKLFIDKSKLNFLSANLLDLIESHRGLDNFDKTNPQNYYLYTGRGPSQGSFHIP